MRVDHHGWQIVLALVATLGAMDSRPRRSGIIAGVAMAAWINISIEGLPFAAAFGMLFGWQWLADPKATEQLKCYLDSFAASSILLFTLMHSPSTWANQLRDVVTPAHLAAFTVAALVCSFVVRSDIARVQSRVVRLGLAGGLTLATMFIVDPHWLIGPFGSLDPLVKEFWYDHVDEGLPVWRIEWSMSAIGLSQPIVGLVGAAVAIRGALAGKGISGRSTPSPYSRSLWVAFSSSVPRRRPAWWRCPEPHSSALSRSATPGTYPSCLRELLRARRRSAS